MAQKQKTKRRNLNKADRLKQKENLKVLVENSSVGKMRSTGRIFKYGVAGFTRNIWLSIAATLVMTVTLVILIVTIGASLILSSTAEAMRQKIDIVVYFKPGTSLDTLNDMAEMVKTDPNVRSVEVADSAMEYLDYVEDNKDNEDLMEVLDDPAMSQIVLDTMQAAMRIKVYNPDDISQLRHIIETTTIFQETKDTEKAPTYDANRNEIAKISSWANIAKNGGLILGAVFLAISILMIFNTIRMAIFSRREEIYMMRLVGADNGFIRGPFLVEAQICGVISGLLASTLAYAIYQLVIPGLASYGTDVSSVTNLMGTSNLVLVYLIMVAAGMLIGAISARLAMQKYLK